jgi:hypothetical protein
VTTAAEFFQAHKMWEDAPTLIRVGGVDTVDEPEPEDDPEPEPDEAPPASSSSASDLRPMADGRKRTGRSSDR